MSIQIILYFIIINLLIIYFFPYLSRKVNIFDHPNSERKRHLKITPAIGGFIIIFNILLYSFISWYLKSIPIFPNHGYSLNNQLSFYLPLFSLFILGALDDKREINSSIKLLLQVIIIFIALILNQDLLIKNLFTQFLNIHIDSFVISFFFTFVCFIIFINAFNMFDGINLQIALYSLFLLIIIFYKIGINLGDVVLLISFITFLYLNSRGRCFMGDGGTLPISFLISYMLVYNYNLNYILRADEILLMLIIPVLDLLRLFISRTSGKKSFYCPDRNHIHHLLFDKFSLFLSLVILNLIVILPLLFYYIGINSLFCIFISITMYSFTIYNLKKAVIK